MSNPFIEQIREKLRACNSTYSWPLAEDFDGCNHLSDLDELIGHIDEITTENARLVALVEAITRLGDEMIADLNWKWGLLAEMVPTEANKVNKTYEQELIGRRVRDEMDAALALKTVCEAHKAQEEEK